MRLLPFTLLYIATILLVNWGYANTPPMVVGGLTMDPWGVAFGTVFVTRDLAQRELGRHGVLLAMGAAAVLTWIVVDAGVATASIAAFATAELIDWAWYTYGRGSEHSRILASSVFSSPVDAAVFLYVAGFFTWTDFWIAVLSKLLGIGVSWLLLRQLDRRRRLQQEHRRQPQEG